MNYISENITIITTKDGSTSLYNKELDETYHSRHGAIQESEYVYIMQGLEFVHNNHNHIRLFEMGFGTGSNLLLTIDYFLSHPGLSINYTTIEKFPLDIGMIHQLNYQHYVKNENSYNLFLKSHECEWDQAHVLCDRFSFTKKRGDIINIDIPQHYDLIYYDAFAPSKQSEMWGTDILGKVCAMMNKDATLVTYCSQGQFKRNLKSLGMEVTTLQGPPFKKEMVRAIKI